MNLEEPKKLCYSRIRKIEQREEKRNKHLAEPGAIFMGRRRKKWKTTELILSTRTRMYPRKSEEEIS